MGSRLKYRAKIFVAVVALAIVALALLTGAAESQEETDAAPIAIAQSSATNNPNEDQNTGATTKAQSDASEHPAPLTIAPGDSLWSVSQERLGPDATPGQIANEVERIFELNRNRIGDDPNLILPGQEILLSPVSELPAPQPASGAVPQQATEPLPEPAPAVTPEPVHGVASAPVNRFVEVVLKVGEYIGYPLVILVSILGIRILLYFRNFFLHWPRYRRLKRISTQDLKALPNIPFVKVQITTRGTPGTTEVIRRGIQNIVALCEEAPTFYSEKLSVEVITESRDQKEVLEREFARTPVALEGVVLPILGDYETPKGTLMKARALHYMVELRRKGFNRKPGRTFIVHYDEESVMEPDELRKLIHYLATTGKKLTEGPIIYPLEFTDATTICRAMESVRPIGCHECREVMETGTPLHLHGSNLVIDEDLENELGWDIGTLDGQPLISEDYVFGVLTYLKEGPEVFGWHGSMMLEQPPFSFKSAFKQRFRWIFGVLQGMAIMQRMPEFSRLSRKMRLKLIWSTRFRILTFALGMPTGALSLLYLLYQAGLVLSGRDFVPLPLPLMLWMVLIGFLWLNMLFIGAWYNLFHARQLSPLQRWSEGARTFAVAPVAGLLESTAGLWAVIKWMAGSREVSWKPTPKTKLADKVMDWRKAD